MAVVRYKLDYVSIVCVSTKLNILKELEIIHNSALRITVGTFRTRPINGILSEISEPPLQIRRKFLSIKFAAKVAFTPQNPVYQNIFKQNNLNLTQKNRSPLLFYCRIKNFLNDL